MESLKAFINEMNNIKDMIIDYIDDDAPFPKFDMLDSIDYNYPRKLILIEIFHLIENIANNHFRCPSFFVKIERLIHYFEKELIFHQMKSSKFSVVTKEFFFSLSKKKS